MNIFNWLNLEILKAPVDDKPIIDNRGSGVESIYDALADDDDDKKEDLLADDKEEDDEEDEVSGKGGKKTKEDDETDEDEEKIGDKDEEKKLELEDDEEPELDEEELVTPASRKQILKKYPTIFKEFPYLEKAMYREQAYTEVIPTVAEAKELVERVKNFDRFESEVFNGSSESLLKAVKDTDSGAFTKIVDNYLGNLKKVDEPSYYHVIGNVVKSTVISMAQQAQRSNNDNLKAAAQILNEFIFGTTEFSPPSNLGRGQDPEVDSEKSRLQQERAEYFKERFDSSVEDLSGRVSNILKSTIVQHIDPKDDMTGYVKKNAVREALENLEELIGEDDRFVKMKDRLWEKAVQDNFSVKSLNAIRNAYLNKAKTLLPSVIQKSRNTALKGLGKRVRDDNSDSRPRSSQSRGTDREENNDTRPRAKKGEIPRGMSNRDFIMSD
jgi:hypothetical protein